MADTAWGDGHRTLYHWQPFCESRLADLLSNRRIYCSSPGDFNDPWDCKPHFNSELLSDPSENEQFVQWAVDSCKRLTQMSQEGLDRMRSTLLTSHVSAAEYLNQISSGLFSEINARYRIYCLGPDADNLLMWAHYADNHRGICLEFDLRNDVMCGALRCEYLQDFPIMRIHDDSDQANLQVLLTKGDAWSYEREYRLVAQERTAAVKGAGTLMTDQSFLQLPLGALRAVIVGCQAEYDRIRSLVAHIAPEVLVKRAVRIPNRYQLEIAG